MTNREIVKQLREAAQQKKLEYVVNSVKARLARKALKESLFSKKSLKEDVTPAATAPGMGGSSVTTTPSSLRRFGSGLKSSSFDEYPKPDVVEDDVEAALEKPMSPNTIAARFLMGQGAGTYRQLLADLKAAEDAASSAKVSAMTADDLIDTFKNFYPELTPEEQKRVRAGARKYLLGFKRGFGANV